MPTTLARRPRARLAVHVAFAVICGALVLAPALVRAEPGPVPWTVPLRDRGYQWQDREDGVHVYKHRKSRNIRIAAEGKLPGPPARVLAALLAYHRHAAVMERLAESRVLRRGKGWLVVYQRLDLPMIDDRDFALMVRWREVDDEVRVTFRVDNRHAPPRPGGVVRLTHHQGLWQLRPADGGRATWARFQVSSDMGGMLPRWMAASHADDDLPSMFASVRKLMK